MVIGTGGPSTAKVGSKPSDDIVVERGGRKFRKKRVKRDAVEGFGKINGYSCCSCRRFGYGVINLLSAKNHELGYSIIIKNSVSRSKY